MLSKFIPDGSQFTPENFTMTIVYAFFGYVVAYFILRTIFTDDWVKSLPKGSGVIASGYANRILSWSLCLYYTYYFFTDHGALIMQCRDYQCLADGVSEKTNNGPTETEKQLFNFIIGYLLYDSAYGLLTKDMDATMIFHHAFGLFASWYVLAFDYHGWDVAFLFTLQELTNNFLNGRFYCKVHDIGLLLPFFEIGFVVLFFVIRMVFLSILGVVYFYSTKTFWLYRFFYPVMQAMNLVFWMQIFQVLKKNYINPLLGIKPKSKRS